MKSSLFKFIFLTVLFVFQSQHSFAFDPDTILQIQVEKKLKKINSGYECVAGFLNSTEIKNPHFPIDESLRRDGFSEFYVQFYVCDGNKNLIRTFSDKPYTIDNAQPFIKSDFLNLLTVQKPLFLSQAVTFNLEGGMSISLNFYNLSLNSLQSFIVPKNPTYDTTVGLSIEDLNQLFEGIFTFIPRQQVIGHEEQDGEL